MFNWFKNLFNPRKKNGNCKWWAHQYASEGKRIEFMSNTGQYIDGKPIQRRYYYYRHTCTRPNCSHTFDSDTFSAGF